MYIYNIIMYIYMCAHEFMGFLSTSYTKQSINHRHFGSDRTKAFIWTKLEHQLFPWLTWPSYHTSGGPADNSFYFLFPSLNSLDDPRFSKLSKSRVQLIEAQCRHQQISCAQMWTWGTSAFERMVGKAQWVGWVSATNLHGRDSLDMFEWGYPLVNLQKAIESGHRNSMK